MDKQRTFLDFEHPCLAPSCNAPWLVRQKELTVDGRHVRWVTTGGDCSLGFLAHDPDEYNQGLEERIKRGWSQQH
jgi:hypothetical protein